MGISDDIKPKKVHRYVEHSVSRFKNEPVRKREEPRLDEDEKLLDDFYHNDPAKLERLEDDFFDDKQQEQVKITEAEHRHRPVKRYVVLLLIVALLILVIVQNVDIIKSYFLGNTSQNTSVNTAKDDSYTGETTTTSDQANSNSSTIATAQPAATPTTIPTAPTFSIEVLNGNGTTGSADKVKAILEAAGLTIEKVTNAKSFSYQKTYIYYKTGKETEAARVKSALASRDCVVELSNIVAKDYDVVVTVGKN